MTTQTNNTAVNALTLVANLFTAIDSHQANTDALNVSYVTREQALKAFKDSGYTSVQDGRKRGAPKKNEVPNNQDLKDFFNSRFLGACNAFYLSQCDKAAGVKGEKPTYVAPTEVQISANLKQQISCLNYYLKTGMFTTNVGRDKFKNEQLETAKTIDALEKKAKAEQAKADKAKKDLETLAKRQAEINAKAEADKADKAEALAKTEAEADKADKAEAEALAKALAKPTAANKRALAKAQAEAEALAKAEADKAKAEADKLVKQVQAEALAKVKAKPKTNKDDEQVLDNIYKSAITNLTEEQIEKLINKLTVYLDLG